MAYSIHKIADIINAEASLKKDVTIEHLLIDSRRIVFPSTSLFFALSGPRRDGHDFIPEVYERGVRCFVVNKGFDISPFSDADFLFTDDVLQALQNIAAYHRQQFNIPVIGITGSNGKTIVKEWLNQLLQQDYTIVRSPRSYNSQIGVPLSVWQMNDRHTLGIFEAGISTRGEMEHLQKVIRPTVGIFTTIGEAHSEGFKNEMQKVAEKIKLFKGCKELIYHQDDLQAVKGFSDLQSLGLAESVQLFSWSRKGAATLSIKKSSLTGSQTFIEFEYKSELHSLTIPFTDTISVNNVTTCICTLLYLGYDLATIQQRILQLQPLEMRMQLKRAVNNCYILNDSYSNDTSSLGIALDHLQQQASGNNTTVILSDILQSGLPEEELYKQVAIELKQRNVGRLIGIGKHISAHHSILSNVVKQSVFYVSTEQFLDQMALNHFKDEYILLKGARVFEFERISRWLEQKVHQTVMEINLTAMVHNLKEYQKCLQPSTKLMAMVKAFSYGSGSAEVARILQYCKVDYLAVAYADEGVELRKADISLPIMVMNADEASFDALLEYNLEPEIYSFGMYASFKQYLLQQGIKKYPVHIKINTGMNRLGFEPSQVEEIAGLLKADDTMFVKSAFSHLVASESPEHDAFTQHQAELFIQSYTILQQYLQYDFIKHIDNSSGIFRHPDLQFDMVRLGIGLYGVDSSDSGKLQLEPVATVKSTIAQIRKVKSTETVGYSRKGILYRDSIIATVRIGYADGFSRRLGNGIGSMYINGKLAPVIGNVAMDMVMIDITDIENVKEGDVVEIFGKHLPVQQVAAQCGTISYEIMTSISQRVKRIYLEE